MMASILRVCIAICAIQSAVGFSPPISKFRTHHVSNSISQLSARGNTYKPQREDRSTRYNNNDNFYDDLDNEFENDIIQQERFTGSINCKHYGECPGCVRDMNIAEIDVIDSARLYFSSSSIQKYIIKNNNYSRRYNRYDDEDEDDEFYQIKIPSPIKQWRTQAKLAVSSASTWSRAAGCTIGLYQRNSHNVLSIPDCAVHHPSINKAVEVITQATQTVKTPAYDEDSGEGLLRYIQLQVELSTGKICLSLVMNAEKFKETQPHLSYLVKELKKYDSKNEKDDKLWHSIWVHCNDSHGNAIFARDVTRWHPVDGPPYIREQIPGSDPDKREGLLYFQPFVFRQGNLQGFHDIAKQVWESIPVGSKVCELYAGVGLLGLSALLHHGKMEQMLKEEDTRDNVHSGDTMNGGLTWLRCSDDNPENARCFERAVNSMPMSITGRAPRKFNKDGGKKGGRGRGGRGRNNRRGGRGGRGGRSGQSSGEMSIKDLMDSMNSDNGGNQRAPESNPEDRVTYMQANAALALHRGQALGANVLIVDPPRKGLDEGVLEQLSLKHNPNQMYAESPALISHLPRHTINWTNDVQTLIYVSCGFDALARDLDTLLTSNAGWKLESATGYVLFPGSNHVETVVVLQR